MAAVAVNHRRDAALAVLLALTVAAQLWLHRGLAIRETLIPCGTQPVRAMVVGPAGNPLPGPADPSPSPRPGSAPSDNRLVICSHGTNSHKEVFLPLALELARSGAVVIALDSTALSTDEGLPRRVEEIAAAASWAASATDAQVRPPRQDGAVLADTLVGPPPARLALVGHSDGVPPSFAAARLREGTGEGAAPAAVTPAPAGNRSPAGSVAGPAVTDLIVLGSLFVPEPALKASLRGYVGGFDQVFPVARMRESAQPPNGQTPPPISVSWLSDHFTEQYDPVLIGRIAAALNPGTDGSPWRPAASIALLALGALAAAGLGMSVSHWPGTAGRLSVLLALPLLWSLWPVLVPAKILVAAALAGAVLGPVPVRIWRGLGTFLLLMLTNVALTTREFWAELPAALPWLIPLLPWYAVAWTAKIALFWVSLLHRLDPADWTLFPAAGWVLALAGGLLSGGLTGLAGRVFAGPAPSHGRVGDLPPASPPAPPASGLAVATISPTSISPSNPASSPVAPPLARTGPSPVLAFGLFAVMALLWGIRFLQGMVQWEILLSVSENYLRMLVLPTIYLVLLARRLSR